MSRAFPDFLLSSRLCKKFRIGVIRLRSYFDNFKSAWNSEKTKNFDRYAFWRTGFAARPQCFTDSGMARIWQSGPSSAVM